LKPLNSQLPVREPSVSEVRTELQEVLSSPEFRQSRGLAKLLRYICSKALLDETEPITEYTIAMDVFGKPQGFKESKDAHVRVEVHRLRKRLAEYYQHDGASHHLRIVIPTGQYLPQFQCYDAERDVQLISPEVTSDPAPLPARPEPVAAVAHALPRRWPVPRVALAIGSVLAIAALAAAYWLISAGDDALDSFWRPVFSSPNPILLCVGNLEGGQRPKATAIPANLTVLDFHSAPREMMLVSDATTLSRFTGLLESKGRRYRVASQSEATFSDLQNGPAVLIGLANNDWTERLVGKLRFSLDRRPPGKLILRDRENPARDDWSLDYSMPYLAVTRDYALVVRVTDPKTEQMVVTAAGISAFGTLAAGEFLTNPQEFRKIEAIAPKGWRRMNFEMILSTDVIRGKSGHPAIVASHFW
jgi:hypothetical protein